MNYLSSLAAASLFGCLLAQHVGAAGQVSIETSVTRATVAEPEVHLLLRNASAQPIEFVLWLGYLPGLRKLTCAGDLSVLDKNYASRFVGWDGVSVNPSSGVIPAKGWSHRSIAIGTGGSLAPCKVPYLLVLQGTNGPEKIEGTVEVSTGEATERGNPDELDVALESMVEVDEVHKNRIVVRLLATNNGTHPLHLLVTERSLECAPPGRAAWALHHTVLQGEDVGPFPVLAKSWAVFTMSVDVSGERTADQCTAHFQVSADTNRGARPVGEIKSLMKPAGFYSGIEGR